MSGVWKCVSAGRLAGGKGGGDEWDERWAIMR